MGIGGIFSTPRHVLAALCGIAIASSAATQPASFGWRTNDQPSQPDPSRASKDGFGAMIVITDDADAFYKAWANPSPPTISTTDRVVRGKKIEGIILFSNCKPLPNGNCRVEFSLDMEGPGGAAYGEPASGISYEGPPLSDYALNVSRMSLGFRFDDSDKPGRYVYNVSVTDIGSGIKLRLQAPFVAQEQ